MIPVQADTEKRSLLRRIFTSKAFLMFLFIVVLSCAMFFGTTGFSGSVKTDQAEFLADAVRRSAVQSYALEGRFPDNLSHLEENYGLIIDRSRYAVYYEPMGGNILPQIRVVTISK